MALALQRRAAFALKPNRLLSTPRLRSYATVSPPSPSEQPPSESSSEPNTHYRITLRRSAISLGAKVQGTLISLGIHRRMQTVYHRHTPETAGKILRVKELVEVENVPASAVRTKLEQRAERKATRGYEIVGSRLERGSLDL